MSRNPQSSRAGRWFAHGVVMAMLLTTAATAHVWRFLRRALGLGTALRPAGELRVLLIGTFYNANWLRSHAYPLTTSPSVGRVYVVTDKPLFAADKVEYVCPPALISRLFGRMVGRLWVVLRTALVHRPDIVMGYHIMPNGLMALAAGSLVGARTVFQLTGGPVQVEGGGCGSENVLLRRLGGPSQMREGLMFHCVRLFDCVAVRGRKAVEYVRRNNLSSHCVIIPGSVDCDRFAPEATCGRDYDMVSVGRLVMPKRYDRLVALVAAMQAELPRVRVAVVGDGPLLDDLRRQAGDLGVAERIDFLGQHDDIVPILRRAKAFVMTSENEGLSIAMVEAMATGLPAIVPDVGDLGDVVRSGETGLLIDPAQPAAMAGQVVKLLADADELARLSIAARREIVGYNAIPAVAARWEAVFRVFATGGAPATEVPSLHQTPRTMTAPHRT
jgi:glycosyltransferase involved in cell wall biosynthesis